MTPTPTIALAKLIEFVTEAAGQIMATPPPDSAREYAALLDLLTPDTEPLTEEHIRSAWLESGISQLIGRRLLNFPGEFVTTAAPDCTAVRHQEQSA